MITIYNTLTRKKEAFQPLRENEVRMYVCGVTVYDDCHIGHARSLYVFEVIRNYLRYRGFRVVFVRNITDIDDKIIQRARQLNEDWQKLVERYIHNYYRDLDDLGLSRADYEPRATENISEMIAYIAELITKGYAYITDNGVYFSVQKFKFYGRLSGQSIDEMRSGARIDPDEKKQSFLDFALWKKAKEKEPSWESPWGRGRPGWHIECSVMSQKYLKVDTLDIHGGGRDLVFPHHENEIAQSEALCGRLFAKYWIHHGLLTIDNQKMAKSLGNFVTIQEVLRRYPADVLKLFYLQAHYGSTLDFSWKKMEEVKKAYERILILINRTKEKSRDLHLQQKEPSNIASLRTVFMKAMDDDFNMPQALGVLFDLVTVMNKRIDASDFIFWAKRLLDEMLSVFGLQLDTSGPAARGTPFALSDSEIDDKVQMRLRYRSEKKFAAADEIRRELTEKGVILEDTKEGTTWRRKI